jgi:hypothetical protein
VLSGWFTFFADFFVLSAVSTASGFIIFLFWRNGLGSENGCWNMVRAFFLWLDLRRCGKGWSLKHAKAFFNFSWRKSAVFV